jgi:hypothetical protein
LAGFYGGAFLAVFFCPFGVSMAGLFSILGICFLNVCFGLFVFGLICLCLVLALFIVGDVKNILQREKFQIRLSAVNMGEVWF